MGLVGKESLSVMFPPSLRSGNHTSLGASVSQTATLGRVPEIPRAAHLTCAKTHGMWFRAQSVSGAHTAPFNELYQETAVA